MLTLEVTVAWKSLYIYIFIFNIGDWIPRFCHKSTQQRMRGSSPESWVIRYESCISLLAQILKARFWHRWRILKARSCFRSWRWSTRRLVALPSSWRSSRFGKRFQKPTALRRRRLTSLSGSLCTTSCNFWNIIFKDRKCNIWIGHLKRKSSDNSKPNNEIRQS